MRGYKIVTASDEYDLEKKVNSYLETGYKAIGGVCISQTDSYNSIKWTQALIWVGKDND